jgi:hypothetical protein
VTRHGLPYTPDEIAYIRSRWGEVRARVIAEELGRTVRSVRKVAANWAMKRTARQRSVIYRQWERHSGPRVSHG